MLVIEPQVHFILTEVLRRKLDQIPKIAGVVVLFNSSEKVLDNVKTYLGQIEILYAVDNSPESSNRLAAELQLMSKVRYIGMGKNLGIAHALNVGARKAIEEGCDYILAMDDDSSAAPDMVNTYVKFLQSRDDKDSIGIISPSHFYRNYTEELAQENREVKTAITSGSLFNLRIYQKTGSFLERLFIDYVDFEYCLRLREHGYKVFRAGDAVLYHSLGELISHRILFRKIGATHHSPVRMYYRTRNRLYVAKRYFTIFPGFVVRDLIVMGNELIKIILFETERSAKMRMVFRGARDFFMNASGEYREASGR